MRSRTVGFEKSSGSSLSCLPGAADQCPETAHSGSRVFSPTSLGQTYSTIPVVGSKLLPRLRSFCRMREPQWCRQLPDSNDLQTSNRQKNQGRGSGGRGIVRARRKSGVRWYRELSIHRWSGAFPALKIEYFSDETMLVSCGLFVRLRAWRINPFEFSCWMAN